MCLRSSWDASSIADPEEKLTLDAFCRLKNSRFPKPIPIDGFVSYGQWFQNQVVPDLDRRGIRLIEPDDRGFKITLSDGETFASKRVVVAAGIRRFVVRPSEFDRTPAALASHSSEHTDLDKFNGQSVVVIGAGQSAMESAALLKEAGAEVEVICPAGKPSVGRAAPQAASSRICVQVTLFSARCRSGWDQPPCRGAACLQEISSLVSESNGLSCHSPGGCRLAQVADCGYSHHLRLQCYRGGSLRQSPADQTE